MSWLDNFNDTYQNMRLIKLHLISSESCENNYFNPISMFISQMTFKNHLLFIGQNISVNLYDFLAIIADLRVL